MTPPSPTSRSEIRPLSTFSYQSSQASRGPVKQRLGSRSSDEGVGKTASSRAGICMNVCL